MKNRAFTLAELMIVLTLIGIITSIGIITVIRPWEITFKYSYNKLFNALNATIYNYMTSLPISIESNTTFPDSSEDFCKALVSYLNSANNATLTNNSCSATKNIVGNNPHLSDFTQDRVQLVLSNGIKIWIGSRVSSGKKQYFTYKENNQDDLTVNYYIVYADINGNSKPNNILQDGYKIPDIVPFAVTDKYSVVPLGFPTVDRRYLSTYITFPSLSDDDEGNEEINDVASQPMTYYEAKVRAYGTYDTNGRLNSKRLISEDIIHSYNFEENVFAINNPFRLSNIKQYYKDMPKFDVEKCGNGYELGDAALAESSCEVKIYDYN